MCDNFVKILPHIVMFLCKAFVAFMLGCYVAQFFIYGFELVLLGVCHGEAFKAGVCFKMTTVIYFVSVGMFIFFLIRAWRRVYGRH